MNDFNEDLKGDKTEFVPVSYNSWEHMCRCLGWMPSTHARHRDAIKACWLDSKRKTRPPGKQSRMGGKKGVFEAWVNEVLSPIWGEEERMSERLPMRQTDIPADGSFDSTDKCFITAGSTCSPRTLRGANQWIQSSCTLDFVGVLQQQCCVFKKFGDVWADSPPREWLVQLWHSTYHQSGCKLAPRTPGCAAADGRRR